MAKKFKLDTSQSVTAATFNYLMDNIGEGEFMQEFSMDETYEFEISLAYGLIASSWNEAHNVAANDAFYLMAQKMPYTQDDFDKILGKLERDAAKPKKPVVFPLFPE